MLEINKISIVELSDTLADKPAIDTGRSVLEKAIRENFRKFKEGIISEFEYEIIKLKIRDLAEKRRNNIISREEYIKLLDELNCEYNFKHLIKYLK